MPLHSVGCGCAACAPQVVRTPPEPLRVAAARIQAGGSAKPGAGDSGDTPATRPIVRKDSYTRGQLTPGEQRMIAQLQARDLEVRAHEAAHQSAGGGHAGGASFAYQTGPDGRQYAIGGSVPIDMSPVRGDPQATISKMLQVRAAALAPAQPSAQDIAVAAAAGQQMAEAQRELTRLASEQQQAGRQDQEAQVRDGQPQDGQSTKPTGASTDPDRASETAASSGANAQDRPSPAPPTPTQRRASAAYAAAAAIA